MSVPKPVAPSTPQSQSQSQSFKPLVLLSSPQSTVYAVLHPLLLGGGLYATFSALTTDPVAAGFSGLPATAAVQTLWCLLCLPAYKSVENPKKATGSEKGGKDGSTASERTPAKKPRQKVRFVGDREEVSLSYKITTVLLSLLLTGVLAFPILLTFLILFGGPITTHLAETSLLAAHLSLLSALPLFYTRGLNPLAWTEIVGAHLPIDEVFGGSIASLVGCWVGAIVIPLDWDREWQRWPVPILAGAFGGYIIGRTVGSVSFVKGTLLELGGPVLESTKKAL